MTNANNEPQTTVAIPGDRQEKTGYQPERPENVVDVPPENLTPPSGESPIANSPPSSGDESSE